MKMQAIVCESFETLWRDKVGYKTRGARIQITMIKGGTEIRLSANREGLRYLSNVCNELLSEDHDPQKPPHAHIEPALNTAEEGSVPMEVFLNPEL